jgi:RNA polymerase sigma factor for flagellar operon FliA
VRTHLPLAHHLVREFAARIPSHVDRYALTSAALYALAASAKAFDPTVGAAFSTFAAARIRGALLDELRAMDWASRSVRTRSRQVEAVRQQFAEGLGRMPTTPELAEATGLSAGEVAAVQADVHRATVHSLDALGLERSDAMPATTDGPEALVLRREELAYLRAAIADLPDRLRYVVVEYFFANRRMAEIASDLNVTESRVSQMRSEALRCLNRGMRAALDGVA